MGIEMRLCFRSFLQLQIFRLFIIWHLLSVYLLSADVAHQFQYAVRVIGSNYAPTIERDEFLVSEKIKKECE